MKLAQALSLPERGRLSLVGGGGKSTLLICLSRELAEAGRRVVAVTTTRITRTQGEDAGFLLIDGGLEALGAALADHRAVCAASLCADGKLGPPPPSVLAAATGLADWVLAEADGARALPIKAPADHEPVLLPGGDTVAVAGLSALGRPLEQVCFRPERAAAVLGVTEETLVTPTLLARLLTSERGQYKDVRDPARFRVVLNQADLAPLESTETAKEILRCLPGCTVVTAALREEDCIKGVFF